MYIHAVLPAVTRRRKRRTRNARGSATGSGGKTETGAEMRENVPAARRAKTRSGNASGNGNASENASGSENGNGSASLRAIKETSRFVLLSGVRRGVLHSRGGSFVFFNKAVTHLRLRCSVVLVRLK